MKDVHCRSRTGLGLCFGAVALLCGACEAKPEPVETTGVASQALTSTATRVLGFEATSDWTTTGGQLGIASRHIEGTAALSITSPGSFATLTSRTLSSLGTGVTSTIGFDLQVPEAQPNPGVVGTAQLSLSIPSKGLNNVVIGLKDFANMPRGIFRRVEFPLSSSLQQALNGTYSDLRFSIALNVPVGATPYFLDRFSFGHASSEPVSNARNASILGFETLTTWTATGATTTLVDNRSEKLHALSVTPTGYTVLKSDRLATPSAPDAKVGFDLHLPSTQPNPANYGEVKLFLDLPSQGIYSAYIGRNDLLPLPTDAYARVSFTLPASIATKLTQEFDDLRFRIELNTPPGAGPYFVDRFRFGSVTAPTESISVSMPTPANLSPNQLLLLAKDRLTIGAGVRLPIQETRMVAASLGSLSVGQGAEVDSLLASGRVDVGANAKVRGFIAGTSDIHTDGLAQIFGQSGGAAAPTTVATWTTSFEPSTLDVIVNPGERRVLSAGRYRNVTVTGGTLALSPGTYRLDTVRVGAAGVVEIDTNRGGTTAFVRSELRVDGRLLDTAMVNPDLFVDGRRLNSAVWLYSGTNSVRIPLNWPGLLVAPGATITPFWNAQVDAQRKPSLGGIWAGTITLPPPPQNLFGDVTVLRPPFHDLLEKGSSFLQRSPTDVRVTEQPGPTDGSVPFSPVLVRLDNPKLFGEFDWHASDEGGNGSPPYYTDGGWTRIAEAHLALRHSPSDDLGWSALLLPGAPGQSPTTTNAAMFQTRAFNLYHGRTFRVTRSFFHMSDATPVGFGADANSLYVRLDPEILVVPVLPIVWDFPEEMESALAQIDFLATRQFSASTTNVGEEPFPSKAGIDPRAGVLGGGAIPPDEIWSQCGIQIQAIGALYLGPPNPTIRPTLCVQMDGPDQDYALDYEDLAARIKEQVPADQFEQVFGSDLRQHQGLHPIIIQYGSYVPGQGQATTCGGYGGKTDTTAGHIQLNRDTQSATAHEIGHVLFSGAHSNEPQNLMTADSSNRELTPAQCALARQRAATYDARLRQVYLDLGLADDEPSPLLTPVPRAPGLSLNPLFTPVCCEYDEGKKSRAIATICLVSGGQPASDCYVCCRTKRACPADACCAYSSTRYDSVDVNDCEPEDVVSADSCNCCNFGSGDACKKANLPIATCNAAGGQVCPNDPR